MTREQIEKAAVGYAEKIPQSDERREYNREDFIAGAKWRINSVWHDASEKPEIGRNLLTYLGEDKFCEIDFLCKDDFDWEYYADIRGIVRWAYIEDLLPDGKEEI